MANVYEDFSRDTHKRQAGFGVMAALLLLEAIITTFYALGWSGGSGGGVIGN